MLRQRAGSQPPATVLRRRRTAGVASAQVPMWASQAAVGCCQRNQETVIGPLGCSSHPRHLQQLKRQRQCGALSPRPSSSSRSSSGSAGRGGPSRAASAPADAFPGGGARAAAEAQQEGQLPPLQSAADAQQVQLADAQQDGVPHFVDTSADEEPYSLEDTKVGDLK